MKCVPAKCAPTTAGNAASDPKTYSRDPRVTKPGLFKTKSPAKPKIPTPPYVNPTQDTYQYSGEALISFAAPLGPIGGGSVALAGDGGLRQWQINNVVNHDAYVWDSFFAIKTVDSDSNQAVCVFTSYGYID